MPNIIENNIVEMSFDNSNFEKNAKTSLSTIEKLKNALNFSGSANSLDELSRSSARFSMANVGSSVEIVKEKFSALQIVGVGALLKIGEQAVTTGERLAKSMSTDQIMAGWDKFAKKTTSTATLLGQGFDMETVTAQLERLNWFTDETSYNFTDMVDSIGKFTASGKDLVESVDAMQGIANWAALSGQNAQTASRAMYQLSQAMGSGFMKKEDYKSIQNASMDTDEFRQKALDAAVALGTLKKNADGTYKSLMATGKGAESFSKAQFTEKLTEGLWFTDEVMMKVFNDYSKGLADIKTFIDELADDEELLTSEIIGAKEAFDKGSASFEEYAANLEIHPETVEKLRELVSGLDDFGIKAFGAAQKARTFEDAIDSVKDAASTTWMNIFELFIGNAEQATEVWTDLANYLWDVFVGPIDKLYKTLKEWVAELDDESGNVIDIFRNIAGVIESITEPIKDAFSEIFPKKSASDFKKFIGNLNKLLKNMRLNGKQTEQLKNIFKGFFSIIKAGLDVIKDTLKAAKPLVDILGKIATKVLFLGSALGKTISESKLLTNTFSKMSDAVGLIVDNISDFAYDAAAEIKWFFEQIKSGESIIKAFANLMYEEFRMITLYVVGSITDVIESITGIDVSFVGKFLSKVFSYGYKAVVDFINNIKSKGGIKGAINTLFNLVKDVGIAVIEVFEEMTGIDLSTIKVKFETIASDIRDNLLDFVSSFDGIDSVTDKFVKLGDALDRIKNFFTNIIESVKKVLQPVIGYINKLFEEIGNQLKNNPLGLMINIFNIQNIIKLYNAIKQLSGGISGFVSSINDIKKSFSDIKDGVVNTLNAAKDSLKLWQEEIKSKLLRSIGISLVLLAGALFIISRVDTDKFKESMLGLAAIVGELVSAFAALTFISNTLTTSGLVKIIPAMLILTLAVSTLVGAFAELASVYVNSEQALDVMLEMIAVIGMLVLTIEALNLISSATISAKQALKLVVIAEIAKIIAEAGAAMASALKILEGVDPWNMMVSWGLLTMMFVVMFEELKTINVLKTKSAKNIIATAIALAIIGVAMKQLAEAIHMLTDVEPQKLVVPFIAIGVCLDVLMSSATKLSNRKVLISTAISIVAIAIAMKILCDAVLSLVDTPWDKLAIGFVTIMGLMAIMVGSINAIKEQAIEGGAAMLLLAGAIWIISKSLLALGKEDPVKLAAGLVLLAVAVAGLTYATKEIEGCIAGAFGLLIMAGAIAVLSASVIMLQNADLKTMLFDLIMLGVSMLALVGIAKLAENVAAGAAILLLLSGAMLVFSEALKILASNDPLRLLEDLGIALLSLVAVFGVIIGISAAFNAVGPVLLIGAALFMACAAMIGIGVAAIGAGLSTIALGLTSLEAVSGSAAVSLSTICSVISQNLKAMFLGGAALIFLGAAMIVASVGGALLAAVGVLLSIGMLAIAVGLIALAGAMALLNLSLGSFGVNAKLAVDGLQALSIGIVKYTPALLAAATEMLALKKVFNSLAEIFGNFSTNVYYVNESFDLLNGSLVTFTANVVKFSDSVETLVISINQLSTRSTESLVKFSAVLIKSATVTFNVATRAFTIMGMNLIIGFVNGMNSKVNLAYAVVRKMANMCAKITAYELKIKSPSRVFKKLGGYTVEGFAEGLSDTRKSDLAAKNMGTSAVDSLNAAMTSAADKLDSNTNDPIIKPIMDLSDVQNGSNYLDAMISRDRATSISTNYKSNREIQEEMNSKNNSLLSGISNQLSLAMNGEQSELPINVNITLAGDAEGIFRVVMNENSRRMKASGYSPLLG